LLVERSYKLCYIISVDICKSNLTAPRPEWYTWISTCTVLACIWVWYSGWVYWSGLICCVPTKGFFVSWLLIKMTLTFDKFFTISIKVLTFRRYGVLDVFLCMRWFFFVQCSVWVARKPPGFAFIEFDDRRDAQDAIRELDGNSHGCLFFTHYFLACRVCLFLGICLTSDSFDIS
jgi:hypothetical protein